MTATFDAIVIGAGPGGAEAAITATQGGLSVAVLDEQASAGGQIWRAAAGTFPGPRDDERRAGDSLRQRFAQGPLHAFLRHRVWSVVRSDTGFRVDALGPGGPATFTAPALVVATGAHERVTPFPGWTLPGVIGLAAATVLLKSHGVAPGKRVAVAGCGPLLLAVAAGLVKAGVTVVAVADMSSRRDWAARLPGIAARRDLALRGLGWLTRVWRAGVPVLSSHGVRRAEGEDCVRRVVIGPVDAGGAPAPGRERSYDIDALVVGHGLTMACEITRLLRADHRFERALGGWLPVTNGDFQTSIAGLYAIGDGAGIRGQAAATLAGQHVGHVLARGRTADVSMATIGRDWDRLMPFSRAMAGLMAQRPGQVAAIAPETIVCRCEDVTRGELDSAIASGARDIDQLKHFTRCGMGPCQGRICGDTAQELLAQGCEISREDVGQWTGRPPLRPVTLGQLIGEFDYADIPIPVAAPL